MTEFLINAKIDPSGAITGSLKVERQLNNLERRGQSLQRLFGQLFVGFSLARGVREAINLADSYQLVENRLKSVTDAGTDVAEIQEILSQVSNRTRSSFQGTVELYSRLIVSSKELGRTQGELISFTERLNKTLILSGATVKEAENATIQLSQGLASGALRGDELRSVLEQLPAVADVIARGLGVTRGELKRLGEQGKITANAILDAFEELGGEIDERFGRTVPTLGQSFTILGNNIGSLVDEINDAVNGIAALSKIVLGFADAVKIAEGAVTNFQAGVRRIEEEGGLASVGAQILSVNKELRALESREVIGEAALARIEVLRARLKALQGDAREATQGLSDEDRQAQVRARAEAAEAAKQQREQLEKIRGPQEKFAAATRALNALLEQGKITTNEYNTALAKVEQTFAKSLGADSQKIFDNRLQSLIDQNNVLRVRLSLGDEEADKLEIVQALQRKGVELNETQQQQLLKELTVQKNLEDVAERRKEEQQALVQALKQEDRRIESLERQLDVTGQLAQAEADLQELARRRPELIDQINERLEENRLKALEASTAFGDGFERAFIKIKREAEDLAAVGEKLVNVFANRAADAIAEFVTTGQFNFREFATSILSDIAKIIARLLIVQALNSAFGGSVVNTNTVQTGANLAGSRRNGGTVTAGREFLVGEDGPERVTLGSPGVVTSNAQLQEEAQGGRGVTIVNVMDQSMVAQAIAENGATQDAILNFLSEKKDTVKETLS